MKQDKGTFVHRNVKNIFSIYERDIPSRDLNTKFALGNCIFRAVALTKNIDSNKYGNGGYEIVFDVRSQFALPVVE